MSIVNHPIWPEVRPFVHIHIYARDNGRHRIDIRTPADRTLYRRFLDATMPCVVCQRPIHPIRGEKRGGLYYACTCEQKQSLRCSRSHGDSSAEYQRVKAAIEGWLRQLGKLFE